MGGIDLTKEKLRAYRAARMETIQLQDQLRQLRQDAQAPRTSQLSAVPSGGSHGGSAVEGAVVHLVDLERLYELKIDQLAALQLDVEQAINSLDSVERVLMRARYLDGLKWEEVCVVIGYSWQQTHRIHARALRKIVNE